MEDHRALFPGSSVPIPEEVSVKDWPFPYGPLPGIQQYSREVDRMHKLFASTYISGLLTEESWWRRHCSTRLESEHCWVLTNEFYHVCSLQVSKPGATVARRTSLRAEEETLGGTKAHNFHLSIFACARAVACIKLIGTNISEAKIYLQAEASESSVQDVLLNTEVFVTFKGVSIDMEGRFRCHDSCDAQTLETPLMFPSTPRGPPPGF